MAYRRGNVRRVIRAHAGRVLEKTEQAHIQQLLTSIGGMVYVLGTRRSRGKPCPNCQTFVPEDQGTRQTAGIADLVAFLPPRPKYEPMDVDEETGSFSRFQAGRPVLLFVECKAEGGRLSIEQRAFRDLCIDAEIAHVVGGLNAVIAWLVPRHYVKAENFPHYRQPAAMNSAG
jgi:hypothetical protein